MQELKLQFDGEIDACSDKMRHQGLLTVLEDAVTSVVEYHEGFTQKAIAFTFDFEIIPMKVDFILQLGGLNETASYTLRRSEQGDPYQSVLEDVEEDIRNVLNNWTGFAAQVSRLSFQCRAVDLSTFHSWGYTEEGLKQIKADDLVGYWEDRHSQSKWSLVMVDRVTKTQIIIGGTRFRRENGREVGGGDSFHYKQIRSDGEQLRHTLWVQEVKRKKMIRRYAAMEAIKKVNYDELSLDVLEGIAFQISQIKEGR